jgi:uncharacterized protein
MSAGLFALLDDIAAIAKVAAASLDDTAAKAVTVSKHAAGIVIDDTAVTPRYVVGFAAKRELPIIGRIAWGSLKNKLLYLLPAALVLTAVAPWAITPLLMAGGAFLCFEGYEKLHHLLQRAHGAADEPGHAPAANEGGMPPASAPPASAQDAKALEDAKVAGAIRTDFILSAEIMAISLGTVTASGFWSKAFILTMVALFVTVMVYGAVALIVKADDAGIVMARKGKLAVTRAAGHWLVTGMPSVLQVLSLVGMAAMLWVGGGIVLHGLAVFGLGAVPHAIRDLGVTAGSAFGPLRGLVGWLTEASVSGVFGVALGWLVALGWSRVTRMRSISASSRQP